MSFPLSDSVVLFSQKGRVSQRVLGVGFLYSSRSIAGTTPSPKGLRLWAGSGKGKTGETRIVSGGKISEPGKKLLRDAMLCVRGASRYAATRELLLV
jgi:hypothetical protein